MDTVLYKNVTAIALTIKKLKEDVDKMNSTFKEETSDLKNRNKITADNSKIYIERLKASTNDKVGEINKQIAELNKELKKIDINREIVKELQPYATNEALQKAIKDLQKSIDTISLTEGKQGEKGKDGLNGRDGKNGTNGVDGKDGKDGKDGTDGLTPVITEVETETLEPSEYADVEVERNSNNEYKMKFKIPKGMTVKGAQGQRGADGLTTSVNGIEQVNGNITLNTDNIPETTTNMYVPALPTTNPTSKYLNGEKEWATVTGGVTDHTELTNLNGDSDYQHITTAEKAKAIADYLKLDQTTPQTITGDIPFLDAGRTIDSDNQLVDKKYVDDNDIAKITTLDKTANYSNYAIVDSGWKYTFNRTNNIITSVTKEAV